MNGAGHDDAAHDGAVMMVLVMDAAGHDDARSWWCWSWWCHGQGLGLAEDVPQQYIPVMVVILLV